MNDAIGQYLLIAVGAVAAAAVPVAPDPFSLFLICLAGCTFGTLGRFRYWIDKNKGFIRHTFFSDVSAIGMLTFIAWYMSDRFELSIPAAGAISAGGAFAGVELLRQLLEVFIRARMAGQKVDLSPPATQPEEKP